MPLKFDINIIQVIVYVLQSFLRNIKTENCSPQPPLFLAIDSFGFSLFLRSQTE
jgi:hypothetical protein